MNQPSDKKRKIVIAPPGTASGSGGKRSVIAPPGSASGRERKKVVIAPPGSASGGKKADSPASPRPKSEADSPAEVPVRKKSERPHAQPAPRTRRQPQQRPVYIQRKHQKAPQAPSRPARVSDPKSNITRAEAAQTLAVVLVTRNDEDLIRPVAAKWREEFGALSTRWYAVDLGSTDATVAALQGMPVKLSLHPGGRAEMMQTLDLALDAIDNDAVLLVDVRATHCPDAAKLVAKVHQGAPLAVPAVRRPGIAVVSMSHWRKRRFSGFFDLFEWAVQGGTPAEVAVPGGELGQQEVACVGLLVDRRKRRWIRELIYQLRRR